MHLLCEMYKNTNEFQDKAENFEIPFWGKLSQENRWVKLAELIPWQELARSLAPVGDAGSLVILKQNMPVTLVRKWVHQPNHLGWHWEL